MKWLLTAGGVVILLVCAWLLQSAFEKATPGKTPTPAIIESDTLRYTTRPLDPKELTMWLLPVPLPADATNIQFAQYAEWQAFDLRVAFYAPNQTCIEYAKGILDEFNKHHPDRVLPSALEPIDARSLESHIGPTGDSRFAGGLLIPWFRPYSIQVGMAGGAQDGHRPKVWVDTELGVFYYEMQD